VHLNNLKVPVLNVLTYSLVLRDEINTTKILLTVQPACSAIKCATTDVTHICYKLTLSPVTHKHGKYALQKYLYSFFVTFQLFSIFMPWVIYNQYIFCTYCFLLYVKFAQYSIYLTYYRRTMGS